MSHQFPLVSRSQIAQDTMSFTFDTKNNFEFKAGQSVDIRLINPPYTDREGDTRTFSIASAPYELPHLTIATRMRSSAYKNSLRAMPIGSLAEISPPMGHMTLHGDPTQSALICTGGIGITPFMSMIRQTLRDTLPHSFWLFYTNKRKATTAFHDELTVLARKHQNLKIIFTLTDEAAVPPDEIGRITSTLIKKYIPNPAACFGYTAGPPAMTEAMIALFQDLGLTEERIKAEDFAGY